jgi:hypothetical protein
MNAPVVTAALGRTIAYSVATLVGALVLAAFLPQPAGEVFATIAYLAAILTAIALAVRSFLPADAMAKRTLTTAIALRTAANISAAVTILSMIGAAAVSQPSGEALAALAYVGSIAMAIAIALLWLLRART